MQGWRYWDLLSKPREDSSESQQYCADLQRTAKKHSAGMLQMQRAGWSRDVQVCARQTPSGKDTQVCITYMGLQGGSVCSQAVGTEGGMQRKIVCASVFPMK